MMKTIILLFFTACTVFLGLSDTYAQQPTSPQNGGNPMAETAAIPQCVAEREGQLSCQANRACRCIRAAAQPHLDLPARWKWDCSIKRPLCSHLPADNRTEYDTQGWSVLVDDREADAQEPPF